MQLTGRVSVALAAAALLSGCASGPNFQEMASSIPTLGSDAGRVYFLRDSTPLGMAIQPEIRVNDEAVGRSRPGGFFYIDRKPGMYVAAGTTEVESQYTFDLKAGETRYIRTSITFGILAGRLAFQEEPAANGHALLDKLSYTGDASADMGGTQMASVPAARQPVAMPATTPSLAPMSPAPAPVQTAAAATTAARPADTAGKVPTLDDLRYLLPAR
ncbi:Protein of unknown function [Ralstonia sp. 25mfcol4.1]|uniref:DUF2846 domain-containing protein n=1 Tax=Ralstonia sp. 25mfcol4.1 TaxID=1761899 RepID=UPI00088CB3C5|nr:DUF2846 domain-containing protein [Ralstonia sp. 25mfcol4.1]SDP74174.1 Protein of unknown function [Ralstonia sp. 25mfcol4.1]